MRNTSNRQTQPRATRQGDQPRQGNRARQDRRDRTTGRIPTPRQPSLIGPDGKRITLSDLPLVAYRLKCDCVGRAYGVTLGDLIFCDTHADQKKVTKILA